MGKYQYKAPRKNKKCSTASKGLGSHRLGTSGEIPTRCPVQAGHRPTLSSGKFFDCTTGVGRRTVVIGGWQDIIQSNRKTAITLAGDRLRPPRRSRGHLQSC